jgi:hypothetical protein
MSSLLHIADLRGQIRQSRYLPAPSCSFKLARARRQRWPQVQSWLRRPLRQCPRWVSVASFLARSPNVCLSPDSGGIADIPQPLLGANSRPTTHSITSSAAMRRFVGISRPSLRAVRKLITRSNFVGCTIGKSPAVSPFRMRPT